ncbi:proteasome-type protease [Methyloterricola oryzae]|uniref:proteasome-type protease n=1 Tax=Methyloterricola oryzae TaxID=1495050 RepID=UPI0005EAE499|nr:proteasome-type protease [Methyloterricola oryzae]
MTYCLAIKLDEGLVLASDSRTNAGVDYASVYSKMYRFDLHQDRFMVLLSAGNLATTQAVVNQLRRDLENPASMMNLNTAPYLFDAATYVGNVSVSAQQSHSLAMQRSGISTEASFILGGQIQGQPPEIFLIYPQGNAITPSLDTPYLQIGETKYGKPVLVRTMAAGLSLEDAARCALVSLDSTMKSNISVGPPLELMIYRTDSFQVGHYLNFDVSSTFYNDMRNQWCEGIRSAFDRLPRFDWEVPPGVEAVN